MHVPNFSWQWTAAHWAAIPLALLIASTVPAQAQSIQSGLSAAQLFAIADAAKAEGQTKNAEIIYTTLSHDPDAEIRAEARFRKGMMLADIKRYADAAVTFRALLDEKPNAARVRLELARVLAMMDDDASAQREIRKAQAVGLPPEVAVVVDQFAGALRSPKRIGGSIEAALAPDSNINRATDARTLDTVIAPLILSEDARARSGLGLKLGGQGYVRLPVGHGVALLPRITGQGSFYRTSELNDSSGTALLGLEWQSNKDRLNPSIGYSWRWFGGNIYARTQSVSLDWLHRLGQRSQLDISASASRLRYAQNTLQDGSIYNTDVALEYAFTPRLGARIGASLARQTARDPGYATTSGSGSLLVWREAGQTTLFVSARLRRLEGDAALFLFRDRRREWLYQTTAGATFRQLTVAGFAPIVRAMVERNASTVGIYDYRRTALEFGITRAF